MKRCAILVLYDQEGIYERYIFYLIQQLKTITKRIIVVCNGEVELESMKRLEAMNLEIVCRENQEYDGGAYKEIILNYLKKGELAQYDELILCNDSNYGPIIPLVKIFQTMENKPCDFWGFIETDSEFTRLIQSYFLVFRNTILTSQTLESFFASMPKITSFHEAVVHFECGIYKYLDQRNFVYTTYCDSKNLLVYDNPYLCIKDHGFVFIKKKCFSKAYFYHSLLALTLCHVKDNFDYDITLILEHIRRAYQVEMNLEEDLAGEENKYPIVINKNAKMQYTDENIQLFINKYDIIYVYGAGLNTILLLSRYENIKEKVKALIVSDGHKEVEEYKGIPILEYGQWKLENKEKDYGLIVTPAKSYSSQIKELLGVDENIMYMFKDKE